MLFVAVAGVVAGCAEEQVARVDAGTVVASVTDQFSRWYLAAEEDVCEAVGKEGATFGVQHAVSAGVSPASPEPAGFLQDVRQEVGSE